MNDNVIKILSDHNIYPYGSEELSTFEQHMTRYFEREYQRWSGNKCLPEDYGVSSFEGSISNIATRRESLEHYDNKYRVFRAFLDKTYMAYTMGFYGATSESPAVKDITIERAQENKYRLMIERAGLEDGQKVLDLGCGFGGLSKFLLKTFPDMTVIGVNPSNIQTHHIKNVLIDKDTDFDNTRFRLIHAFFEDITANVIENNYCDRVVSAGLLEHVTNIELLQHNISRVLKKGGKCLHHSIVSADTIPNFLNSEDTHMGHYYPGAHIWPFNEPRRHNKHLRFVEGWFVNGMNYWHTLDEWHKRFWNEIDELYPKHLSAYEVEDWNRYFSLCKSMFRPHNGKSYGNGQFLYEKS
jgi:cyclopropane-fatty-acyl-phospholipid synthase